MDLNIIFNTSRHGIDKDKLYLVLSERAIEQIKNNLNRLRIGSHDSDLILSCISQNIDFTFRLRIVCGEGYGMQKTKYEQKIYKGRKTEQLDIIFEGLNIIKSFHNAETKVIEINSGHDFITVNIEIT